MPVIIAPSILSADFGNLQRDVEMINNSEAEWVHIDVMDGVFVPNISFGFPVLKAVKKHTRKFCDVHLMIAKPQRYFQAFKDAGADNITFHYEAVIHLDSAIHQVKDMGIKVGVAINPSTPVSVLKEVIHLLDVVLIMSVNPGFGGQKFIGYATRKVRECRELIQQAGCNTLVEVDGGIDLSNVAELAAAGAGAFVAGNSVFSSPKPLEMISQLRNAGLK